VNGLVGGFVAISEDDTREAETSEGLTLRGLEGTYGIAIIALWTEDYYR
jgi:hypothetical protein